MNGYDSYSEYQPRGYVGGYPVYTAYLIVAIYTVSMIVSAVLGFTPTSTWYLPLIFDSSRLLHGEVWRALSYGLVNQPSISFVIDMYMLAVFGREIERFFGQKVFLRFWIYLYLLTPLLLTLIGLRYPQQFFGETGSFAMFIAFAALYPNALLLFNIVAKWAAFVLVAVFALIDLSNRNLIDLISLLATTGFAVAYVRAAQGRLPMPSFRFPKRKPKLRVLPDLPPASKGADPETVAEMDELLDKIAKSGLGSLSAKERAQLDAARDSLLKKSGKGRKP